MKDRESDGRTHISGSFCVSMTAAMGIPKLETGPQKSVFTKQTLALFKSYRCAPAQLYCVGEGRK
jgi:hypothetical protein